MAREHVLCMDILNYSSRFFDIAQRNEGRTVDFESDLRSARGKIQDFVAASRASGYKIIGFIDKSISTGETQEKWISRREEELYSGRRNCVANMNVILGSIFQSLGVSVHYSTIDCDDTIAAFAYHMNGSVLSRDCDFFRYYADNDGRRPPYQVYFNFSVCYGRLSLAPHGGPGRYREPASPRKILGRLPQTQSSTFFLDEIADYFRRSDNVRLMYRRGCGSNLTHEINPHLQVCYNRSKCWL